MKHKVGTASQLAQRFLEPGDAVLEIGAADGVYTRVYADRVGPTGHVLAVDPHPDHVLTLKSFSVVMPWVTTWPGAVGATIGGEAWLHSDRTDPKRSSLWPANVPDLGEVYPAPMTTIDALVASMSRAPQLIQVDAQGAEAEILKGAPKTLTLPIVWVIELWSMGLSHAGASVSEVMSYFQSNAYTARSLRGAHVEWTAAHDEASRGGYAHADFVMVPEDLMEADW